MTEFKDMLLPPPVLLPEDPNTNALTHPESPLAWAILAEQALEGASTNSTTDQRNCKHMRLRALVIIAAWTG